MILRQRYDRALAAWQRDPNDDSYVLMLQAKIALLEEQWQQRTAGLRVSRALLGRARDMIAERWGEDTETGMALNRLLFVPGAVDDSKPEAAALCDRYAGQLPDAVFVFLKRIAVGTACEDTVRGDSRPPAVGWGGPGVVEGSSP